MAEKVETIIVEGRDNSWLSDTARDDQGGGGLFGGLWSWLTGGEQGGGGGEPPPPEQLAEVVVTAERPRESRDEAFLAPPPIVPVATVAAAGASRALPGPLALVALVPTFLEVLGDVDQAATERMSQRINPPNRPPRPGTSEPELPPNPLPRTRPDPWQISGPPIPDFPTGTPGGSTVRSPTTTPTSFTSPDALGLPTVTVTGRAPGVFPVATWLPQPSPIPGIGYDFVPFPDPETAPEPSPAPIGDPIGDPLAQPFPWPSALPEPEPIPGLFPVPETLPQAPTAPDIAAPPVPAVRPTPRPTPQPPVLATPFENPLASAPPITPDDPCNCSGTEQKKKKGKKKPRTVCYRGTYVEKSKSLSKRRRVRVSCSTGKPLS